MKKIAFFLTIFISMLLVSCSMAFDANNVAKAEQDSKFTVSSDARHFNPITGVYDLNGHVRVEFPTHGEKVSISADTAQVKLYKQEVYGRGNIQLNFGNLLFKCDKVTVKHKDRTAYVDGNVYFKQYDTTILADNAAYCWKTKLAVFKNASLNGKARKNILTYDILNKKIIN